MSRTTSSEWKLFGRGTNIVLMLVNCDYDTSLDYWSQQTQNIFITFIQRRPNVFDVGPTLYKCYTYVLCIVGSHQNKSLTTLINFTRKMTSTEAVVDWRDLMTLTAAAVVEWGDLILNDRKYLVSSGTFGNFGSECLSDENVKISQWLWPNNKSTLA